MDDLQQQIIDLQESVELLTLDKEQLALDKELLEEQLLQAQEEINALKSLNKSSPVPTESPGDGAELQRVKDENFKLREALRRLNEIHEQDKQLVEEQKLEFEILSSELEELRAYKDKSTLEIEELKQSVDSMSSFEAMIEKLTSDNLDLSSSLSEAKQTIQELEDAIEVNEELDQQQRDQIESDRKTIDSLEVSVHNFELLLQEKDSVAHDLQKKLDAMRQKYYGEKQEVEKIQEILSLGSQDHKAIEATVKQNQFLKTQNDELKLETWNLRSQIASTQLQRLRFQALYTRLNDFFGSTSFFIEESKLLNIEILCITTICAGFEAGKRLTLLLNLFLQRSSGQAGNIVSHSDAVAASSALLFSAFQLMLPLQASIVKKTLPRIRDHSRKIFVDVSLHQETMQVMQQLQNIKAIYDDLLQHAGKYMQPLAKLIAETACNELMDQDSLERNPEYIVLKTDIVPALKVFVETLKAAVSDITDGNTTDEAASVSQVFEQGLLSVLSQAELVNLPEDRNEGSTVEDDLQYLEREMTVEALFLICSALLDQISYQSETSNWSATMSAQALDTLRSVKIELEECVRISFKVFSRLAAQAKYHRVFLNAVIEMVRLFRATEKTQLILLPFTTEEVHPSFRQVLSSLRNLKSEIVLHHQSSASSHNAAVESMISFRYFPALFLLGNHSGSASSSSLGEQMGYVMDRYWSLLLQGDNELLVAASTLAQRKGMAHMDVMSWKERVRVFRTQVLSKWDTNESGKGLDGESVEDSKHPFQASTSGSTAAGGSGNERGETRIWKRKLDAKEDELRTALKHVQVLQTANDQLTAEINSNAKTMEKTNNPAQVSGEAESSETTIRLKEEIKALEEALESVDKRYEDVVRENKLLKATNGAGSASTTGANSPAVLSGSGSGRPPLATVANASAASASVGALPNVKMPRAKTSLDLFEATKALVAGAATPTSSGGATPGSSTTSAFSAGGNPLAAVGVGNRAPSPALRSSTPTNLSSGASSSFFSSKASAAAAEGAILGSCTVFETHLLEQVRHWKRIALRRLTESLRPLPVRATTMTTTTSTTSSTLSTNGEELAVTDEGTAAVVHKTRLSNGAPLEVAFPATYSASHTRDCLAAYRALRLARVQHARIRVDAANEETDHRVGHVRRSTENTTLSHILYRLHKQETLTKAQ